MGQISPRRQLERTVGHDEFVAAVRPFADVLRRLASTGFEARQELGFDPAPDSAGMAELAKQHKYRGEWDDTPIDTARTHIGLLLVAGEDAMHTFANAIVAEHTPLYAYVPLARSGLECLALAHWLSDPEVDVRERFRRSLNERLYSASEQARLPDGLNPEPGRQTRLLEAQRLGFELTRSKKGHPRVLAPPRPSITGLIQRVVGGDRLGQVVYSYFSAISHGTLWGLVERVDASEIKDRAGPVVEAPLMIRSDNIGYVATALILAHRRAFGGFARHMGWEANDWYAASRDASELIGSLLEGQGADEEEGISGWRQVGPGGLWLP